MSNDQGKDGEAEMLDTDAQIEAHTDDFLCLKLPEPQWNHLGHFAAALCLVRRRGLVQTERDMPGKIQRFNVHHGGENTDTAGYHHTITLASLRAAAKVIGDLGEAAPLSHGLRVLMDGPFGNSRWLQSYWTTDVLMSVTARRRWVAPDLATPEWLVGD